MNVVLLVMPVLIGANFSLFTLSVVHHHFQKEKWITLLPSFAPLLVAFYSCFTLAEYQAPDPQTYLRLIQGQLWFTALVPLSIFIFFQVLTETYFPKANLLISLANVSLAAVRFFLPFSGTYKTLPEKVVTYPLWGGGIFLFQGEITPISIVSFLLSAITIALGFLLALVHIKKLKPEWRFFFSFMTLALIVTMILDYFFPLDFYVLDFVFLIFSWLRACCA